MKTMAPPTRPTDLPSRCVRLAAGPAAVAEARRLVRAAIGDGDVPVDPETAILLTSELVTNAIRHEAGQAILLVISCSSDQLRVAVHDTSCSVPVLADVPADAETGRGLMLVAALAAEWGFYATSAGKAVYFTLAGQADTLGGQADTLAGQADTLGGQADPNPADNGRGPQGLKRGDGEPKTSPRGSPSPPQRNRRARRPDTRTTADATISEVGSCERLHIEIEPEAWLPLLTG